MEVRDLAVGAVAHPFYEEENDALEDEEDKEDDEDLGQFVPEKQDDVVVPVLFHNVKDVFILRGRGQKEHH